jgi:hypothetical protein
METPAAAQIAFTHGLWQTLHQARRERLHREAHIVQAGALRQVPCAVLHSYMSIRLFEAVR